MQMDTPAHLRPNNFYTHTDNGLWLSAVGAYEIALARQLLADESKSRVFVSPERGLYVYVYVSGPFGQTWSLSMETRRALQEVVDYFTRMPGAWVNTHVGAELVRYAPPGRAHHVLSEVRKALGLPDTSGSLKDWGAGQQLDRVLFSLRTVLNTHAFPL